MLFFFVDDSRRESPSRKGMGPLLAIGGVCVSDTKIKSLEEKLNQTCIKYGFPPRAMFKWSPGRELWMRDNLIASNRNNFFKEILKVAEREGVRAVVVVEDISRDRATNAPTAEIDLIRLFFERTDWISCQRKEEGVIVLDRPSGDRSDEDNFLFNCLKTIQEGTDYTKFKKMAMNPLTTSSKFTRLLQLADLVTSCSLAYVSGENTYSPEIFSFIKNLLCGNPDRIGGIGLKIHPDFRYCNLYHWLLGDEIFWKRNMGISFPILSRPYSSSSDTP